MNIASIAQSTYRLLASRLFFRIVMGFFIVSSVYIALVSLYPMAFDENFHVGLIQIYAQGWTIVPTQTPAADVYGAIAVDPSYLYHYLMSFPYRFFDIFTNSVAVIVVLLRFINIAFCVAALLIFRNLLTRAKVSPAIIHTSFAFFVLIPVVPLLAGQVNYDNLLMLLLALALLLVYQIRESVVQHTRIPVSSLAWLICLLLYTSVVKYAFLPIALAIVLYLLWVYFTHRQHTKRLWKQLLGDVRRMRTKQKVLISVVAIVGLLLFAQRYVTNIVQYHHPVPDCAAVLNEERCEAYGPWGRDHRYQQNKTGIEVKGPIAYSAQDWSWGMWHRLFFTLAGPTNSYQTQRHLPIPSGLAIALFSIAALSVLWFGRSVLRRYPVFVPIILITIVYIGALWFQQYQSYVQTARPVAINGRYLVPLLPMLGAFSLLAIWQACQRLRISRAAIAAVAVIILMMFLQGGGPITYMVRSNPVWFWQNNTTQTVTDFIRSTLKPVIIGD